MSSIPDSEALFDSGLGGGKPFLGSPVVVDRLLRDVLHKVTEMRGASLVSGADPQPGLRQICADLQTVFYGADSRYQASSWNSPEHLGRMLVEQHGIGGDVTDAVARVILRMIRDFVIDLRGYEEDRLTEAQAQASTDALLLKFTRIFVGSSDAK